MFCTLSTSRCGLDFLAFLVGRSGGFNQRHCLTVSAGPWVLESAAARSFPRTSRAASITLPDHRNLLPLWSCGLQTSRLPNQCAACGRHKKCLRISKATSSTSSAETQEQQLSQLSLSELTSRAECSLSVVFPAVFGLAIVEGYIPARSESNGYRVALCRPRPIPQPRSLFASSRHAAGRSLGIVCSCVICSWGVREGPPCLARACHAMRSQAFITALDRFGARVPAARQGSILLCDVHHCLN